MKLLVSYAFVRKNPHQWDALVDHLTRYGKVDVLLDSGAFTAFTSGEPIPPQEYDSYLRTRHSKFWGYIQLDVIKDAEATTRNLLRSREQGLQPIPVLTTDMDVERVVGLREHHERVCMAGGTGWPHKAYMARLQRALRLCGGDIKMHGLGYTRGGCVWRTPLATVDSSTWVVGGKYGKFVTFDRREGCKQQDRKKWGTTPFVRWPREWRDIINRSAVDLDELWTDRGVCSVPTLLATEAWLRYADESESKGVSFFFVVISAEALVPLGVALLTRLPSGGLDMPEAKRIAAEVSLLAKRKDKTPLYQWFCAALRRKP